MRPKQTAVIVAAMMAVPTVGAMAGDPVYQVDVAEEQGEGFVPASDSQFHPDPKQFYADDFTLQESIALERIAWYGYSDYWIHPDLSNFTLWQIRIYEGQGKMVVPGEMIYDGVFNEKETSPEDLGPDGLYGSTMFRQEVELVEPIELEAGEQYWIAIGADAIDPGGDWWLWAQAPPGDETAATWDWDDQEWEFRGPDWDPDWPTYNVAFELFGTTSDTTPGDLNGDGVVDGADLLILLSDWGECGQPEECPADLNGDGFVNGADLLELLGNWS